MESLDGTDWDVVIVGTGLKQSLLALSLSRSGKRVLHVDQNNYYGGNQAAFSLQEAEAWVKEHAGDTGTFSNAVVHHTGSLAPSRSYSLALAPELVFTRSSILPALVSSQTHGQLEFQAVGSWFVLEEQGLVKVPSGREDIFQDAALDLRAKRSFMKFIRFITNPDSLELSEEEQSLPIEAFLQQKFGIPPGSQAAILALTLSPLPASQSTVRDLLPNITRHIQSIGMFGAGFNALVPKWGGLAEIAQVACRAGAVGGGVYCLGKGVASIGELADALPVILSDGERVTTATIVGSAQELGLSVTKAEDSWARAILIVSAPLAKIFPPTSEGGVTPAGAVIRTTALGRPVFAFAHSSDAGECPAGQCVLYASILGSDDPRAALDSATAVVKAVDDAAEILWSMSYTQQTYEHTSAPAGVTILDDMRPGLALADADLDAVRAVWQQITGGSEDDFMKFEARAGTEEDDAL